MKKRAINKFLKSKNVIIASVVGVCVLAGGVSAYYVNNNSPKASVQDVQEVEKTESPTPTPEVEMPSQVTSSPSVAPNPSVNPTASQNPVNQASGEEVAAYIVSLDTKWKGVIQKVYYTGGNAVIFQTKDYKAIIAESIQYLSQYDNTPIDTNRAVMYLNRDVIQKYAN